MTDLEKVITDIITNYGNALMWTFVSLVTTSYVLFSLKELISNVFYYFRVRASDLGKGAMIKWEGKLKMVKRIMYKEIVIFDDEEVLYIPIKKWIDAVKTYPQPRVDQFDENQWKKWDGTIERRHDSETHKKRYNRTLKRPPDFGMSDLSYAKNRNLNDDRRKE